MTWLAARLLARLLNRFGGRLELVRLAVLDSDDFRVTLLVIREVFLGAPRRLAELRKRLPNALQFIPWLLVFGVGRAFQSRACIESRGHRDQACLQSEASTRRFSWRGSWKKGQLDAVLNCYLTPAPSGS
ncbi:MAG: hypothetical protein ACYDBQ_04735 [Thermoplasmatota archaeon]